MAVFSEEHSMNRSHNMNYGEVREKSKTHAFLQVSTRHFIRVGRFFFTLALKTEKAHVCLSVLNFKK